MKKYKAEIKINSKDFNKTFALVEGFLQLIRDNDADDICKVAVNGDYIVEEAKREANEIRETQENNK